MIILDLHETRCNVLVVANAALRAILSLAGLSPLAAGQTT